MKIIVVDDELLQLKTIIEYLEEIVSDADVCAFQKTGEVLEFLEKEKADLAILDIKMPGKINGIGLAAQMKHMIPEIKILFCTGYTEYALDAFRVHANGYLCKPIGKEELQREINYIFSERERVKTKKPFLHTFGNFDLFVNGSPVKFKRSKSKEALAWLTDRKGTWVTNQELMAAIWEEYSFDTPITKYASLLISDLITDLERAGAAQIIERKRGRLRLCMEEVECDYFDLLAGDINAINSFCSEYMSQYSWGEVTLSGLLGIHF